MPALPHRFGAPMLRLLRRGPVRTVAALLLALTALAAAGQSSAPPGAASRPLDVDAEAARIFNSVMSPYCPGVLLAGCGSSPAAALRDSIRASLRRGRTPDEVLGDLVATYGEDVLGMPSYRGTAALVWCLPGLALIVGLGGAWWWARQGRRTPAPDLPPPRADESLRRQLERELEEYT